MSTAAGKGMRVCLLALLLAALLAGCGGSDSSTGADEATKRVVTTDRPPPDPGESIPAQSGAQAAKREEPKVYVPEGPPKKLLVRDMIEGTGQVVKPGDELTVNFVAARQVNGELFESSWEWPKRFTFELAMENVIPGWVKGLPGMREGGRRYLAIPGTLAARFGVPSSPQAEEEALIYVVDLIKVG